MNKFLVISALVCAVVILSSYKILAQMPAENKLADAKNANVLIAYYSYSGNTKEVAQAIHEKVGGDLFEIKAKDSYPEEYSAMTEQAKKEIESGVHPELTSNVADIAQYDIIFLGSPNWWGTITPQVSSFLQSYDLSGKTVIPFITHGGGGVQNTFADMIAQCKNCNVVSDGWAGYGNRMTGLSGWLERIGFSGKASN